MRGDPDLWHALLERLSDISATFLTLQADAGAGALQLFDSWAGALGPADYRHFVLPHSRTVFERTADLGAPRVHFGVMTGELLTAMAEAGPEVVGVDWRVPLDVAIDRVGPGRAVQGNLDPTTVLAPIEVIEVEAADVLRRGAPAPGHVFNLGHGVLPASDPGKLAHLVEFVHRTSERVPESSEGRRD